MYVCMYVCMCIYSECEYFFFCLCVFFFFFPDLCDVDALPDVRNDALDGLPQHLRMSAYVSIR